MPEFKLTKELGTKKFELLMAVDYDEDGNIESQEFYDGVDWIDNPADIKFNSEYCDSDDQDDWIVFINDFMHLFETGELFNVLKTLKEVDDSYYFNEESIDVVVIEEDLI
ncbi:hypothetical protein MBBWO_08140 [Methanobrevibacter woesei]|uniref:EF-hand domain-containing protein n=1 Tax=Methanobrevibacter woesei TaxID=190976 RepID=A0A2U1S7B2_9EURY|nr:hypothetical protein [Methanobrevibacter woesei]MCC9262034.1 hypothetical protein [Methanobrevibacter woesei]PWB85962.1 hypothetical protein MBBWO_08140 [Methanobrevibacter woesei]